MTIAPAMRTRIISVVSVNAVGAADAVLGVSSREKRRKLLLCSSWIVALALLRGSRRGAIVTVGKRINSLFCTSVVQCGINT